MISSISNSNIFMKKKFKIFLIKKTPLIFKKTKGDKHKQNKHKLNKIKM